MSQNKNQKSENLNDAMRKEDSINSQNLTTQNPQPPQDSQNQASKTKSLKQTFKELDSKIQDSIKEDSITSTKDSIRNSINSIDSQSLQDSRKIDSKTQDPSSQPPFAKKSSITTFIPMAILVIVIISAYIFIKNSDFSIEGTIKNLWENHVGDWGYIILFCWSILEGEWGLLLAGIAANQGHLDVYLCIFIAGLGGFSGDQIYFYIGRLNKSYVQKKFRSQRRKFALASRLMQKYGWPIIFVQRYMYGLRTIIPISIGLTRYSALKFAFINLISAWMWAAITIVPAWYFGDEIIGFIKAILLKVKQNPLIFVTLLVIILCFVALFFWRRGKKKVD